ncbi:hypothetical protein A9K55_004114 [Cordyceps militaris]|uniref:Glycosyltransferase family 31 protein n=1 Tax=Cordyceps militaris TaxID=73501 RepID=A0A2H4SMD3_CORMI|nr:hypothetical protein A9K55_004114 [Cordyceps militaris]
MGQLVASPFSVPRRLISMLFISAVLAYTFVFLQSWNLDNELSRLFPSRYDRNSSELSLETDNYLDDLIRQHDLSPRVEWAAWNIASTQNQKKWTSLTRVPRRFQPRRPRVFDPRDQRPSPAPMAFGTLPLPSPRGWRPGQFDATHYLFGLSTTYERLMKDDRAMLKNWQWWLTNGQQASSGAHMVVMLDRADDEQMQKVESTLTELAIPAMVYNSGEPLSATTRYAQLAGELYAYGSALSAVGVDKRWFVLMDDAIFFPSLSYLDETLAAYDAHDRVYIGVPSDRSDWEARDGRLSTTGGGVVVLSRRGLGRYLSLSCAEGHAAGEQPPSRKAARHWAATLHECLTTRGDLPMHVIPGLYSPVADDDDASSRSDDLESGARPLALRNRAPMTAGGGPDTATAYLVADECGEACFAQRFLFRDGWVLVNGVSITQYQNPLTVRRAEDGRRPGAAAQRTLDDDGRVRLTGGGGRNVWTLLDSSVDDYGVVWQAYVKRDVRHKRAPTAADAESLDSVIILVWHQNKTGVKH